MDVVELREVDGTRVALVGGKGANLGELMRIDGVRVPEGFCVSTDAFRDIVANAPLACEGMDRLATVRPSDAEAIRTISAGIRDALGSVDMPAELVAAISGALGVLGEDTACAVRSSATAEDAPTASFAGQQDTYLNVVGRNAVLAHVRRCWASLYTERAVTYRLRNGFDQRHIAMAVVVQRMVPARAAGVLFTADPLTSNRTGSSVEASFGLGESLVAGRTSPDVFTVRDGEVVAKAIATKHVAIEASPGGGTRETPIRQEQRRQPVLTDAQVVELEVLGRRIEAHFGQPQDIEWCRDDDGFHIVQSRAITTLFPVPPQHDAQHHLYVSVGHQQMMTDPMRPLGLSFWQLTASRPMAEAGGRLFVDVAPMLASPASRAHYLAALGRSDPLIGDALERVLTRDDFVATRPDDEGFAPIFGTPLPVETDPATVTALIGRAEASLAALEGSIARRSGPALLDAIAEDVAELKRIIFDPLGLQVIRAAMDAAAWIDEQMEAWLDETHAADTLTQSVPHNVTSAMGLALLDVADAIRPHPDVVAFLRQVGTDGFLAALPALEGGQEAADAVVAYLQAYGMRCIGEIDITRTRWSEDPSALVPMILSNVANFEPGESRRRFEQGRLDARHKERELLRRLRATPNGAAKAAETKAMIDRVRTFMGYREYPKYHMVSRYFVYKRALLREAVRLVDAHVIRTAEDIFFLRFEELRDVVRTHRVDEQLLEERRDALERYRTLSPPRVLTSEGEVVDGRYRREDVPAGALVGLPVSAGTVEGRARVVTDIAHADLERGDILVTSYTDPSWTPLFVVIRGLVTEVGGLMTHGAVIAREYGVPAVVNVERATQLLHDGDTIRVHGGAGYVEILR